MASKSVIVVACKGIFYVFANRKDSNHPANPRSLIKAFSYRVYNLWILGTLDVKSEIFDRFSRVRRLFELLWYAYGYTSSLLNG